jgi:hypothetical protein
MNSAPAAAAAARMAAWSSAAAALAPRDGCLRDPCCCCCSASGSGSARRLRPLLLSAALPACVSRWAGGRWCCHVEGAEHRPGGQAGQAEGPGCTVAGPAAAAAAAAATPAGRRRQLRGTRRPRTFAALPAASSRRSSCSLTTSSSQGCVTSPSRHVWPGRSSCQRSSSHTRARRILDGCAGRRAGEAGGRQQPRQPRQGCRRGRRQQPAAKQRPQAGGAAASAAAPAGEPSMLTDTCSGSASWKGYSTCAMLASGAVSKGGRVNSIASGDHWPARRRRASALARRRRGSCRLCAPHTSKVAGWRLRSVAAPALLTV